MFLEKRKFHVWNRMSQWANIRVTFSHIIFKWVNAYFCVWFFVHLIKMRSTDFVSDLILTHFYLLSFVPAQIKSKRKTAQKYIIFIFFFHFFSFCGFGVDSGDKRIALMFTRSCLNTIFAHTIHVGSTLEKKKRRKWNDETSTQVSSPRPDRLNESVVAVVWTRAHLLISRSFENDAKMRNDCVKWELHLKCFSFSVASSSSLTSSSFLHRILSLFYFVWKSKSSLTSAVSAKKKKKKNYEAKLHCSSSLSSGLEWMGEPF